MGTIHHATMKKAEALGITDLVINPVTGNAECTFDGDLYEHESPKDLVALIALSQKDSEKGDEALNELEDHRVDDDALGGEDSSEEDGEGGESKSIVKPKYRKLYAPHHDRNGDDMANAFSAYISDTTVTPRTDGKGDVVTQSVNMERFAAVGATNGVDVRRWAHLNVGQQRMCCGNVFRALLRHGKTVVIGDREFTPEGEG